MTRKLQLALFLCIFSLGFMIGMFKAGWQIVCSGDVVSWPTAPGVVIEAANRTPICTWRQGRGMTRMLRQRAF